MTGASPEKPSRVAEELADYEKRLAAITGKLTMLVWAVGINIAAAVASFGMLVTISSRLGEIAQLLHQ